MSNILTFKDLPALRKKFKNKKIVHCSGCFDITHAGHALFFEDCKKQGDILVVGVGNDKAVGEYKKDRPILNQYIRLKMVSSLKPVDYCYLQPYVPFSDLKELLEMVHMELEQLKPDIYIVNDDAFDIPGRKEILKRHPNITLHVLKRWAPKNFDSISTTKIIKRIQKLK